MQRLRKSRDDLTRWICVTISHWCVFAQWWACIFELSSHSVSQFARLPTRLLTWADLTQRAIIRALMSRLCNPLATHRTVSTIVLYTAPCKRFPMLSLETHYNSSTHNSLVVLAAQYVSCFPSLVVGKRQFTIQSAKQLLKAAYAKIFVFKILVWFERRHPEYECTGSVARFCL